MPALQLLLELESDQLVCKSSEWYSRGKGKVKYKYYQQCNLQGPWCHSPDRTLGVDSDIKQCSSLYKEWYHNISIIWLMWKMIKQKWKKIL